MGYDRQRKAPTMRAGYQRSGNIDVGSGGHILEGHLVGSKQFYQMRVVDACTNDNALKIFGYFHTIELGQRNVNAICVRDVVEGVLSAHYAHMSFGLRVLINQLRFVGWVKSADGGVLDVLRPVFLGYEFVKRIWVVLFISKCAKNQTGE